MTAHPHSISDVEFEQMRESLEQARGMACALEQDLAAANRIIANALTWLDRAHSKDTMNLGMACILDALTGESDIDASCGGTGPLTEQQVRDVLTWDRSHYWGQR